MKKSTEDNNKSRRPRKKHTSNESLKPEDKKHYSDNHNEKKSLKKRDFEKEKTVGHNKSKNNESSKNYKKSDNPKFEKKRFGENSTEKDFKPKFNNDKPFKKRNYNDSTDSYEEKPYYKKKKFEDKENKRGTYNKDNSRSHSGEKQNKSKRSYSEDKSHFYKKENQNTSKRSRAKDDNEIRLNKYIANSGFCSRREADSLIATGAVTVNGKIVTTLGTKINKNDVVKIGEQVLKSERNVYVLLNKPKDYITTCDDPDGRKTVMMLVKDACKERIYPVGRLDRATTGLLLFTNDGDLAKKLTHPKHKVPKIYHVELDRALTAADFQKILQGIELEDGIAEVDELAYTGTGNDKKTIGIEIHQGKNRIVRRIFEHLGYTIRKLDRVYYAGLTKKDLPRGRWRMLTQMEVNMLKML